MMSVLRSISLTLRDLVPGLHDLLGDRRVVGDQLADHEERGRYPGGGQDVEGHGREHWRGPVVERDGCHPAVGVGRPQHPLPAEGPGGVRAVFRGRLRRRRRCLHLDGRPGQPTTDGGTPDTQHGEEAPPIHGGEA
jgi:hypothetical protein